MPRDNELERLRAEVRARHAAANRKISRLRREKGVELSGSIFDLRRDINKTKRYNKAQLNKYLNELISFNSRGTQFVAGNQGKPIPAQDWHRYKSLESKFNRRAEQHIDSVKDVHDPISNMTVGKRDASFRPDRVRAAGEAANRPFEIRVREARNVKNADALAKLTKAMEKKLKPDYFQTSVKEGRKQANKMLVTIGASDLRRKINKLSDYQFDILWNYMNLAHGLSAKYEVKRKHNVSEERWYDKAYENEAADVAQLVEWGSENIPQTAPKQQPRKRK